MNIPALQNFLAKVLSPIKSQIRTIAVRAILANTTEDQIQKCQIEAYEDDIREDVEKFHHFGFKSYAPSDSEAILLALSGNSEHSVIIATENRDVVKELPALEEGDVIFYNGEKKYLHFKKKNIEIKLDKIKIENEEEELITVLSDLIDQVRKSKWNTAIGPQPIFEADGIKLDEIKERLDKFLV